MFPVGGTINLSLPKAAVMRGIHFLSVVKEESLGIYQGKKNSLGSKLTDAGTAHLSIHSVISLHYIEWTIASQARSHCSFVSVQFYASAHLEMSLCWILICIETDHSLANRSGLYHTGAVHRCSKWAWDAFTAYIWDCGRPPPFSTGSENGLVIWLLDWKMNVPSPLSSNWTLAPTDVATIRLMHSNPVWNTLPRRHFRSSRSFWTCPCVLLLSEPHRLTQTNSHRLDWFGISNWTWVDSVHPLSDEWVSAQTWSGAKDWITSSSSPDRLQQTYSKEKSLTFYANINKVISELFNIWWARTHILFYFCYTVVDTPCLTDCSTELCHFLHLGLSLTHKWCPNCTPTRPHTDMI